MMKEKKENDIESDNSDKSVRYSNKIEPFQYSFDQKSNKLVKKVSFNTNDQARRPKRKDKNKQNLGKMAAIRETSTENESE